MEGHTCYHCKQWVEKGEPHDCWTTTEAALTGDLSEDLREAWERLRETAAELGAQRIYASHHSIMFSRHSCYFFVRPRRSFLEVNIFLGRVVQAPQIRKVVPSSKVKRVHVVRVQHRDEVEAPLTDWLAEAYEFAESSKGKEASTKGTENRRTGAADNTKSRKSGTKGPRKLRETGGKAATRAAGAAQRTGAKTASGARRAASPAGRPRKSGAGRADAAMRRRRR